MPADEPLLRAIEAHYTACWGPRVSTLRWTVGPHEALPEGFHVALHRRASGALVFATVGMSVRDDDERLELHFPAVQKMGRCRAAVRCADFSRLPVREPGRQAFRAARTTSFGKDFVTEKIHCRQRQSPDVAPLSPATVTAHAPSAEAPAKEAGTAEETIERASKGLVNMGFAKTDVKRAVEAVCARHAGESMRVESLLREAIAALR